MTDEITRCTCGAWAIRHRLCEVCGQPALTEYDRGAWA